MPKRSKKPKNKPTMAETDSKTVTSIDPTLATLPFSTTDTTTEPNVPDEIVRFRAKASTLLSDSMIRALEPKISQISPEQINNPHALVNALMLTRVIPPCSDRFGVFTYDSSKIRPLIGDSDEKRSNGSDRTFWGTIEVKYKGIKAPMMSFTVEGFVDLGRRTRASSGGMYGEDYFYIGLSEATHMNLLLCMKGCESNDVQFHSEKHIPSEGCRWISCNLQKADGKVITTVTTKDKVTTDRIPLPAAMNNEEEEEDPYNMTPTEDGKVPQAINVPKIFKAMFFCSMGVTLAGEGVEGCSSQREVRLEDCTFKLKPTVNLIVLDSLSPEMGMRGTYAGTKRDRMADPFAR